MSNDSITGLVMLVLVGLAALTLVPMLGALLLGIAAIIVLARIL